MKIPSLQTLGGTAVLITVVGVGGILLLRQKKLEEISGSPYFRAAFKILRAHQGINKAKNLPCHAQHIMVSVMQVL